MSLLQPLEGLLLDESAEVARLDGVSFPSAWPASQTFSIVYCLLYVLSVLYILHQDIASLSITFSLLQTPLW